MSSPARRTRPLLPPASLGAPGLTSSEPPLPARICSYRLQLNAAFTFADAGAIAGYLGDLGVSEVYLSPITQAVKGSEHGYDVTDPSRLNDELGGAAAYKAMSEALAGKG